MLHVCLLLEAEDEASQPATSEGSDTSQTNNKSESKTEVTSANPDSVASQSARDKAEALLNKTKPADYYQTAVGECHQVM